MAGTHQENVLQLMGPQQHSLHHHHHYYLIMGKLRIKGRPQFEAVQKEGLK